MMKTLVPPKNKPITPYPPDSPLLLGLPPIRLLTLAKVTFTTSPLWRCRITVSSQNMSFQLLHGKILSPAVSLLSSLCDLMKY